MEQIYLFRRKYFVIGIKWDRLLYKEFLLCLHHLCLRMILILTLYSVAVIKHFKNFKDSLLLECTHNKVLKILSQNNRI